MSASQLKRQQRQTYKIAVLSAQVRESERQRRYHAEMPDGEIRPDSAVGKQLGFTSDRFEGWLWKTGDRVMISFIVSKAPRRGHLSALFHLIERHGFEIHVPTPFPAMKKILKRKGFKSRVENSEIGPCEIWARRP